MLSLDVQKRAASESVNKLRKNGRLPAVFYGRKQASTPISLAYADFLKIWKKAGESSVIILKEGENEIEALISDIDRDPVKGTVRHADFYAIEKGKKVKVKVPIEFIGVSPAVKDLGGTLVKVLYEVEIEAMPRDLPHTIQVDISELATFDKQITGKDVKLGNGVTLAMNADEVIVFAAEAREEEAVEAPVVDISAIEVEKKGKEKAEEEKIAKGEEAPADKAAADSAKAPK